MAIQIRRITPGDAQVKDFIKVHHRIYADDPVWIPPLDMDLGERLDPKKNPFFEHAEAIYFVAERDGELVGRVSAQLDHEHLKHHNDQTGFFGFLDTVEDPAVASALLDAAGAWVKERGMKTLRGPISLSINEELGTLVEGFDTPPMVLMPHHKPYQGGLIEAAGFTKAKDFYAWMYDILAEPKPRAQKALDEISKDPSVKFRPVDFGHMERDVRIIMEIFNDAWSDNWGFVPMTEAELKKTAQDFRMLLIPEIALIAEIDGEAAAVCVALPNLNEAIRDLGGGLFPFGWAKLLWRLKVQGLKSARLIILGVRKKYRGVRKYAPLAVAIYMELLRRGKPLGVEKCELGWTLEDNGPVNALIRMSGAKQYKRLRVYEKAL